MQERSYSSPDAEVIPVSGFARLLEQGKFTDIVIRSRDEQFHAHKALLYARFRKFNEEKMNWSYLPSKVVKSVLDFAYTGSLTLAIDTVIPIYKLGIELGCWWIRHWCTEFIEENIDHLDIQRVWEITKLKENHTLANICLEPILNKMDINNLGRDFYEILPHEYMMKIIELIKQEKASDFEKLKMIGLWLEATKNKATEEEVQKLLRLLHLENISRINIHEIITGIQIRWFPVKYRQILFNEYTNVTKNESDSGCPDDCCSPCYDYCGCKGSPREVLEFREDMKCFLYGYNNDSHGGRILVLPYGEEIRGEVPFRYFFSIVTFGGCFYIIGGKNAMFESTAQVDHIDPRSGYVSTRSDLQQARSEHSATANDENIFVFGGIDSQTNAILDSCEIYDAKNDKWTLLQNMPTGRRATAAINIPNLGILVVGGSIISDIDPVGLDIAELLTKDGENWTWKQFPFMQHSRVCVKGVFYNERAYVTSFNDLSVDMLTIQPGGQGQWTLVPVINAPLDANPWSLCVSEDTIQLSTREGNVYRMDMKENGQNLEWVNIFGIDNYGQATILSLE